MVRHIMRSDHDLITGLAKVLYLDRDFLTIFHEQLSIFLGLTFIQVSYDKKVDLIPSRSLRFD